MATIVFPGQGSQVKGLGGTLFDEFREVTEQADEILGYSIKDLAHNDRESKLGLTQYTQPVMYTVNALSYMKYLKDTGKEPEYLAGHSLGEYNALFAAGAFDFATGLKLVKERGSLMGKILGGGMAAVIGLKVEQVREVLANNHMDSIDIANLNSTSQIIIAGPRTELEAAKSVFESTKGVVMYTMLNTSGAFHSRYMEPAREGLLKAVNSVTFHELKIPVIANINARPYQFADIRSNLVNQLTNPVKWTESVRYLMGLGQEEFLEIGTGNVLTGLIRRIKREETPLIVEEEKKVEKPIEKAKTSNNETKKLTAQTLGSKSFRERYHLKYAYVAGSMYQGISSKELVIRMAQNGMLAFYGTGGLKMPQISVDIDYIQRNLKHGECFGVNLLHNMSNPDAEEAIVKLLLEREVKLVEASGFLSITPALVYYKAKGLHLASNGKIECTNRILAKVSRQEVASVFMTAAPERIIMKLLDEGKITESEANLLKQVPVADDICVEADSAGHTDASQLSAILPHIVKIRNQLSDKYEQKIHVGAAGGLGTPEAIMAAIILGGEFIETGSINQCTVEAGISDAVKDLLQEVSVHDTEYAPAGDMFELGAKVQVMKRGVFFPARANKLYDLYHLYNSIDEIPDMERKQIEDKYFKKPLEEVYAEVKEYVSREDIAKCERNSKYKMALIFKWYFGSATRAALAGKEEERVNYQVQCGPALGGFNAMVKGTQLEFWKNRHVDEIGKKLLDETVVLLEKKVEDLYKE